MAMVSGVDTFGSMPLWVLVPAEITNWEAPETNGGGGKGTNVWMDSATKTRVQHIEDEHIAYRVLKNGIKLYNNILMQSGLQTISERSLNEVSTAGPT